MMNRFVKYSLITVLALGIISMTLFFIYQNEESVIFSATDTSFIEGQDGRSIFRATIANRGDEPINVTECGYNHAKCEIGCIGLDIINPGEEFEVEIFCDASVTSDELRQSGFYIKNALEGQTESQTTSSGSSSFPSFSTRSSSSNTGGSSRPSSSGSTGGSNQGGSGTNTGSNAGGSTGTTLQTTNNLATPIFESISGSTVRIGFVIDTRNPEINFLTPTIASTSSISCRWAASDLAFSSMPSSNDCSVDSSGAGLCNPLSQISGIHLYYVSCAERLANGNIKQNDQSNNLDLYGTLAGPFVLSDISPASGTIFAQSINAFVMSFNTDEWANCKAVTGSTSASVNSISFSSMPIDCGGGRGTRSCTIPLNSVGDNYVRFACSIGNYLVVAPTLHYSRSGTTTSPATTNQPGTSTGGGTSSSSDQQSAPSAPGNIGTPPPGGSGSGGADVSAEVVRDLDSNRGLFQSIVDWFKSLF